MQSNVTNVKHRENEKSEIFQNNDFERQAYKL
jgi:hypothetical protein